MLEEKLERIADALERIADRVETVTMVKTSAASDAEPEKDETEAEDEKSAKKKAAQAKKKAAQAKKKAAADAAAAEADDDGDAGAEGPDIEDLRVKVKKGIVLGIKSKILDLFGKFDCGSVTTLDEAKYSGFEMALDVLIDKAEADDDE